LKTIGALPAGEAGFDRKHLAVGFNYTQGLALTSAGAGVRFFLGNDLQADIAVAFPLDYRAPENSTRSARLLFSLSSAFKACPDRAQAHCL
jgi:hypothetical protein